MSTSESQIEAMLVSPPEREELVVQFFARDGGQWGELYRENGQFWIELCLVGGSPLRFKVEDMIGTISRSLAVLQERLG